MATSGTYTWTMQLSGFVNAALRKLAVLSGGTTPETYETTNATEALNAMIAGFIADGMPIWKMSTYSFTPAVGIGSYQIGTGQTLNTVMPLKITQAWRSTSGQANVPMNIYTDYNFNLLPQTASPGVPVNLKYQPGETVGTLSIWPLPKDTSNVLTIRYQAPFQDVNASTDEVDFPKFWYEAIIYGLASRLSREYGLPPQDRADLRQEAEYYHQNALSYGTEEGSLYFQPDTVGKWS